MTEPLHEAHDRASWAELFFDLVLVFAVTQAAHLPVSQPNWGAVGQTVLLLALMWWSWVGVTLTVHGVEDTSRQRFFLFASGLAMFTMAITAPHAFTGHAEPLIFASAHLALRLLLWVAISRKKAFDRRVNPYAISALSAVPLVVAAFVPEGGVRVAIWVTSVLLAFAGPALSARSVAAVRFGATHLPERFALFVIIALGECVASVGNQASDSHLGLASWAAVVLTFLLGCGLWWLYFAYGFSAIEHSLRTNRVRGTVVRDVLSYGHMLLVVGLVLVSVGARAAVEHPTATAHGVNAYLLTLGAALFVLGFCFTRWRMFGAPTLGRTVVALALGALTALGALLPTLVTLIIVTVVVAALNAYEHWVVATGRPLQLLRLPGRAGLIS
ncbi:low temperature requirement protein A [Nocardia acidivorans]|uniref:low temperature requirement protein A n=1 Tax=Nocardia acidivorans TaxID=404580 RepID=UPI001471329C|nr:low temperature requirement protein A [Nocardia acidivorans]